VADVPTAIVQAEAEAVAGDKGRIRDGCGHSRRPRWPSSTRAILTPPSPPSSSPAHDGPLRIAPTRTPPLRGAHT
jgi:hypothetical protein